MNLQKLICCRHEHLVSPVFSRKPGSCHLYSVFLFKTHLSPSTTTMVVCINAFSASITIYAFKCSDNCWCKTNVSFIRRSKVSFIFIFVFIFASLNLIAKVQIVLRLKVLFQRVSHLCSKTFGQASIEAIDIKFERLDFIICVFHCVICWILF